MLITSSLQSGDMVDFVMPCCSRDFHEVWTSQCYSWWSCLSASGTRVWGIDAVSEGSDKDLGTDDQYSKPLCHKVWYWCLHQCCPTGLVFDFTACCQLPTTTVLQPFFWDHPGENFWTSCYNGRLTEADTPTIQLGATPSALTIAHLHHPQFFMGRMPFLLPSQQCQSTEGNMLLTEVRQ